MKGGINTLFVYPITLISNYICIQVHINAYKVQN